MDRERGGSAVVPESSTVTFIAPLRPAGTQGASFVFGLKAPKSRDRIRVADEDGARRALGSDGVMPPSVFAGPSIEHLARIALG